MCLQLRDELEELFWATQPEISELTFTNLCIWHEEYGARLTRMGEVVCVFSLRQDPAQSFLLPPVGPGAGVEHVEAALDFMEEQGHDPRLGRVDDRERERLGLDAARFVAEPDRDNWDYVYRVQDLIELDPAQYPRKLRDLERFTRKFKYEYRRITPDLVPACERLQQIWCDEKLCDLHASLLAEARAVDEVLEHLGEHSAIGGAILVNDRVQAFALGEPLNENTVVIHIEKASPDLPGAFQLINQEFLRQEWQDYEFVNREQDMGVAGLRRAKESYLPTRMVEKYLIRRRSS
jgi:hypothetical protein